MIRKYCHDDCDEVLDVWAAASAVAHRFLGRDFLERERHDIRNLHLRTADTWVWIDADRVVGFLSLDEVGALFVDPRRQRSGANSKWRCSLQTRSAARSMRNTASCRFGGGCMSRRARK